MIQASSGSRQLQAFLSRPEILFSCWTILKPNVFSSCSAKRFGLPEVTRVWCLSRRGARNLEAQLSAFRDESCRCGFDLTWMHHIQGIRGVFNTRGGSGSCTFLECLDNLDSREKQRASMSQLSQMMMHYWKWISMKEFESHLVP